MNKRSRIMISICVPTYNGEKFVQECLDSIFLQTYQDFELIVIDDHSTDSTMDCIRAYQDPRMCVVQNSVRLGLVGNWNRCIELANGEYIYLFHQDDILMPEAIQALVAAINSDPLVGFAFSNIQMIDDQGRIIGGHWDSDMLPQGSTNYEGLHLFDMMLRHGNFIPCQTVIVKKICYETLGWFDPRLTYTPDMEMWMRLSLLYQGVYVEKPLVKVRMHAEQESAHFRENKETALEIWRAFWIIFTDRREQIPDPSARYETAVRHLIQWCLKVVRYRLREGRLFQAIKMLPVVFQFIELQRNGLIKIPKNMW